MTASFWGRVTVLGNVTMLPYMDNRFTKQQRKWVIKWNQAETQKPGPHHCDTSPAFSLLIFNFSP